MAFRRERLRIETARHEIEGVLQLPTEGYRSRTTDYLNAHDSDFIALTDAVIRPLEGGEPEEREFVAVNLRHAVLVVEIETLGVSADPIGSGVATLAPVPDPAASVPPPGAA